VHIIFYLNFKIDMIKIYPKKIFLLFHFVLFAFTIYAQEKVDFLNNKHRGRIEDMQLSRDNKYLLSIGFEGQVKKWDIQTGELTGELGAHSVYGESIAISNDNKYLFTSGGDRVLRKWDFQTYECIKSVDFDKNARFVYSPAKDMLAVADWGNALKILDAKSLTIVKELKGIEGFLNAIAFSKDGKCVAFGTKPHKIQIYDTETWKLIMETPSYNSVIMDVQFLDDNRILVAPKLEPVEIWNIPNQKLICSLQNSKGDNKVVYNEKKKICIGCTSGKYLSWELSSGKVLSGIACKDLIKTILPARNDEEIFVGDYKGNITLVNYKTGKTIRKFGKEALKIIAIRYLKDNDIAIYTSEGNVVRLNKGFEPDLCYTSKYQPTGSQYIFFSDNMDCIYYNGWSGIELQNKNFYKNYKIEQWGFEYEYKNNLLVFNRKNNLNLVQVSQSEQIDSICSSDFISTWELSSVTNEAFIVSYPYSGILVYDVQSKKLKYTLTTGDISNPCVDISVSVDGSILFCVLQNGDVQLWDLISRKIIYSLHDPKMNRIKLSPDTKNFLLYGFFGKYQLYNTQTGKLIRELDNYPSALIKDNLVFSSNSQYVAIINADQCLNIFRLSDGSCLITGGDIFLNVSAVSFNRNNTLVSFVSFENTVIVWDLTTNKEIKRFSLDENNGQISIRMKN
jgi:WD40 repeat protein